MSKLITLSKLKTALTPLIALINKKAERPNWNESNYDSVSYIENRPFYSEEEEITFISGTYTIIDEGNGCAIEFVPEKALIKDNVYQVSFNGESYNCVCWALSNSGISAIGNGSLFGYSEGTEDPFLIMTMPDGSNALLVTSSEGTYDISVVGIQEKIVKIHKKYLPELNYSNIGAEGSGENAEIFNDYEDNVATGNWSHAEGLKTSALENYAHAEGNSTNASGLSAHAEGTATIAFGDHSHAEGRYTAAIGDESHAEGYATVADGDESHAEGYGDRYIVDITGNSNSYQSSSSVIKENCYIVYRNQARRVIAVSDNGFTIDSPFNDASYEMTVEVYNGPAAIGNGSHAEGNEAKAIGQGSHAEGTSDAKGTWSHAEGSDAEAVGTYSHAEGHGSAAYGQESHAEGYYTKALLDASHAEGYHSEANGMYSHAEGRQTYADGENSHAEGKHTHANGIASHSEGQNTYANSDYTHAEGYYTTASSQYQHVQGRYNIEDTENKYAHIIGNGSKPYSVIVPSNAHTLDWNGNARYAGDVYVRGTGSGDLTDAKKLATEEFVLEQIITEEEIDEICGSTIEVASEVEF